MWKIFDLQIFQTVREQNKKLTSHRQDPTEQMWRYYVNHGNIYDVKIRYSGYLSQMPGKSRGVNEKGIFGTQKPRSEHYFSFPSCLNI